MKGSLIIDYLPILSDLARRDGLDAKKCRIVVFFETRERGQNEMTQPKTAVVLLSGGLDSTTTVAIAQHDGHDVAALTFRYGQRHQHEVQAARQIAQAMHVTRHIELDIDLRKFGGSALTSEVAVPKHDHADQIGDEIPVTYVPARNTIFLAFALGWAEVLRSGDIFIGVNALDYSGYPDCRPEFITAFQAMANIATKATAEGAVRVRVHTPLIQLSKAEIIRRGIELGVDYGLTTSCYDPSSSGNACGHCDACLLRLRGFSENQLEDPIVYEASES
jgi:7-cyano-7-deazaguanine synthase